MASPIGDAEAVDRCARAFQRGAERLHELGDGEVGSFNHASWRGPRADRSRHLARERREQLRRSAVELQQVADQLRRHASWIRQREDQLRRLERRIRQWALAHPHRPDQPWRADASLIRWWPPPMSEEWEQLSTRLRSHGAVF
jgi:hypothetical protein